ncbi:hypothetical protein ACFX1W_024009 [Malus domestica]
MRLERDLKKLREDSCPFSFTSCLSTKGDDTERLNFSHEVLPRLITLFLQEVLPLEKEIRGRGAQNLSRSDPYHCRRAWKP